MAQRHEDKSSLDFFPTPAWATRALIEHVLRNDKNFKSMVCWEPACGAGHMSVSLNEYFGYVISSDIHDYGFEHLEVIDFLNAEEYPNNVDWVITNPPFKEAEEFIKKGLMYANEGVAMLVRTSFLESVGRYNRLYKNNPPSIVAQFVERVPMAKGRLDKKATTATSYMWLVWNKSRPDGTDMVWIPPCRKELEKENDYGT